VLTSFIQAKADCSGHPDIQANVQEQPVNTSDTKGLGRDAITLPRSQR
jgi:hypothetical protein